MIKKDQIEAFYKSDIADFNDADYVKKTGANGKVNLTAYNEVGSGGGTIIRVTNPAGGAYNYRTNGVITGAIKLTFPVSYSSTFYDIEVHLGEPKKSKSLVINVGGFAEFSASNWDNVFASIASGDNSDYTVRFGNDGTNLCIWIGELDSEWENLQCAITNVYATYNNASSALAEGWNIALVSAFDTVQATKTNNFPYSDANKIKNLTDVERTFTALQNFDGGATAPTPVNDTDVVNKTYVDELIGRDEKYIDGNTTPNYTLISEDKNKFLSFRYADVNLTIPTGVFQNGDVIKGFAHSGRITINSNLQYTVFPMGSTSKCWGYFEIRISSTSVSTPNADAGLVTGDFIKDKTYSKSANGTIWEITVNDSGVVTAADSGLNF
jgi:hypothetical protein